MSPRCRISVLTAAPRDERLVMYRYAYQMLMSGHCGGEATLFTGERALSSFIPLTLLPAQALTTLRKSDLLLTLLRHPIVESPTLRRSTARPSSAPVTESRASTTSVASPASSA